MNSIGSNGSKSRATWTPVPTPGGSTRIWPKGQTRILPTGQTAAVAQRQPPAPRGANQQAMATRPEAKPQAMARMAARLNAAQTRYEQARSKYQSIRRPRAGSTEAGQKRALRNQMLKAMRARNRARATFMKARSKPRAPR